MNILNKFAMLITFLFFFHSGLIAEPENLSINLMWLNACPEKSITDRVRPNPKDVVKSWFSKHPENNTVINFWYDGSMISGDKAAIVEQEKNAFFNVLSDDEKPRFVLRDMQELGLVKEYAHLFAATPVYFQSDLLRFFLAKELIDNEESDTVLYADLNVQPENREYLFDAQTQRFLDEYGFVNLRHRVSEHGFGGAKGFENKLLIMQKNDYLWNAFKIALVQPLENFLINPEYGVVTNSKDLKDIEQKVYGQIDILFVYILSLKGLLKLENSEYFLSQNITEKFGGEIIDNSTENRLSMNGLRVVTKNYYYNDDDLETLFQMTLEDWKSILAGIEGDRAEIQNELEELKKQPPSEENAREIAKFEGRLRRNDSVYKKYNNKILHSSSEEGKKAKIRKIKTKIKNALEKSSWPADRPVPAIVMVAPPSHFG